MLTYKELEQLLQPIQPQSDQQPSQHNIQNNSNINNKSAQNKSNISNPINNNNNNNINNNNNKSNIQQQPNQQQHPKSSQKYSLTLSHRQLRKIPPLIPFTQYIIQQLDLSFNYIKQLKQFKQQKTQQLQYLNISFNFLITIDKLLYLNANRIISVNITDQQFPCLQALYLKNNKIKYFLHCTKMLEILCLDHNQLQKLAFTGSNQLQILSASNNKIQQFQLQQCQKLCFIDLQNNQIHNINKFKQTIKKCNNLLSLNMIGNYISKISHKKYVIDMLVTCGKLVKIDQVMINPHVRQAFKIMNQQDKMQIKMKQTQQKYHMRMQQQYKLKQQMLDKLRQQQKKLDQNFKQFIRNQKQQMDLLQNYAKNNMGKKILGITQENKKFNQLANKYGNVENPSIIKSNTNTNTNNGNNMNAMDILNMKQSTANNNNNNVLQQNLNPVQLGNQLTKYLVQGEIILKHKNQYADYIRNKQQQKISKQSKIKKYLGLSQNNKQRSQNNTKNKQNNNNNNNMLDIDIDNKPNQQDNSDDDNDNDDQLSIQQKQRRKKNMRNPGLVYRNSNQLIGVPAINIDDDISQEEDVVFNKKCLPYLVKNYGFHTVI